MTNDGILGIKNRTENWKTVQHFHGLSRDAQKRLAKKFLGTDDLESNDIQIELFWYGFRDYIEQCPEGDKPTEEAVEHLYRKYFGDLKDKIQTFPNPKLPPVFKTPGPKNYDSSYKRELFNNLRHTEIDIAIRSGRNLILGEAKYQSSLDAKSSYVLVHQLIRQRVMAQILLQLSGENLEISHFLVGDKKRLDTMKNRAQVKFMQCQGWLRNDNVLSWECVKAIAEGKEACSQQRS